jgi:hypothetical protein
VHQVGHYPESHQDARSIKHKRSFSFYTFSVGVPYTFCACYRFNKCVFHPSTGFSYSYRRQYSPIRGFIFVYMSECNCETWIQDVKVIKEWNGRKKYARRENIFSLLLWMSMQYHADIKVGAFWEARPWSSAGRTSTSGKPAVSLLRIERKSGCGNEGYSEIGNKAAGVVVEPIYSKQGLIEDKTLHIM